MLDSQGGVKPMQMRMKKDNRGFSLIELIVAVLVIAIISGGSIVAFGALFSNKVTAAARAVQDGLKQARIDALGLENKDLSNDMTGIYAKFYIKDSELYVDVCSKNGTDEGVLHTRKIGEGTIGLEFWKNGATTASATVSSSETVYVYFKKSTGAVRSVWKATPGHDVTSGTKFEPDILRITGVSENSVDVILVRLTGRSYLDT